MHSLRLNVADFDAALIDLDGTLIDTLGDFVVALNAMLADLVPPDLPSPRLTAQTLAHMIGKGSEHLVASVLAYVQAQNPTFSASMQSDRLFQLAFSRYQKHYTDINGQHARVYPGVGQGLQTLQAAGLQLVCLTNKPLAFARPLLQSKGLDHFFSAVFGGDSFERKKPDPLPLHKACELLGTLPARTLMVGDSSNDAQAARAAGCPVVLVSYGYNHSLSVTQVDADGWLNSLADLRFL